MSEGAALSKQELKSRFGLSERLAIRVAALHAKGLALSEAVIEEAARRSKLAEILLSDELLDRASRIDTRKLHSLASAAKSLEIVSRQGRRTLCLAEEALAEKTWEGPKAPGTVAKRPESPESLSLRPEDLERLKATLLTSVRAGEKIEALRTLVRSPLPAGDQGALALRSLADPDPEVRREATAALEHLGLDTALADALRTVASGTARQKAMALQKVASLAARGGQAERSVVLATLAAGLAFEKDPAVLGSLLDSLGGCARIVTDHPEALRPLVRNLLRILVDQFEALSGPVRGLLEQIGAADGAALGPILWGEIEGVSDRRLVVFCFEALCALPLDPPLERDLCERAAGELARGTSMDDLLVRRMASALQARGDAALRALLAAFPSSREESRAALVGLIDALAGDDRTSEGLRTATVELFVTLLKEGSRSLRTAILEASSGWHPRVPAALKRKLAADLLGSLHATKASRIHELTAAALRKMGFSIVEPLQSCIQKSAHPFERETAARVLAEIAAEEKARPHEMEGVIRFLRTLEKGDRIPVTLAVRCVGRACASPSAPPEPVREVYRDYFARMAGAKEGAIDLLHALSRLVSGPACDAAAAAHVMLKLLDMLESPMPDLTVQTRKTDEGTHLTLGGQTAVYTETIPELIRGIRDVYLGGRCRDSVQAAAVDRLCARYRALAEYREIWAPGSVVDLAEAMGAIAASGRTPPGRRAGIVEALLEGLRSVTLVRIVARALVDAQDATAAFGGLVGRFVSRSFEMLGSGGYAQPEDQRAILESLGRVARCVRLSSAKRASDDLRTRIVDLLLEERERFPELRGLLKAVAASPSAGKVLHARIGGALP